MPAAGTADWLSYEECPARASPRSGSGIGARLIYRTLQKYDPAVTLRGGDHAIAEKALERRSSEQPLYKRIDTWLGYRWVGTVLVAAAIILPLLRQRGTPSWETLWAEDATIYTHQAVFSGGLHSLFRGYNGYLQLPPRLLAVPTPYFSLRYLALYNALAATVVGALLAWSVYHLSRRWLQSRLLRVTLASFVVLMPVLGPESTATITNTTWMFLAVLPWALVSLEERRRDAGLRSGLAFLGATSSVLSYVFLPLAIGWLVYRRTKKVYIVGASFLVGLIVQAGVTLTSPPQTGAPIDVPVLAEATSGRVFGAFLLGVRGESAWWSANWQSLVVLCPVIVIVLLLALGTGVNRRAQVIAGSFVLLAVVLFAIPAWGRGTVYLGIGPSRIVSGHHDLWGRVAFQCRPGHVARQRDIDSYCTNRVLDPTTTRYATNRHSGVRSMVPHCHSG